MNNVSIHKTFGSFSALAMRFVLIWVSVLSLQAQNPALVADLAAGTDDYDPAQFKGTTVTAHALEDDALLIALSGADDGDGIYRTGGRLWDTELITRASDVISMDRVGNLLFYASRNDFSNLYEMTARNLDTGQEHTLAVRADSTTYGTLIYNDQLVFFGSLTEDGPDSFLISDGTPEGTRAVTSVSPISLESDTAVPLNGLVLLPTNDGSITRPVLTDFTPEGTRFLGDVRMISRSAESYMLRMGDRVFFNGYDAEHGEEIWVTDGTDEGTRLLAELRPGSLGSDPDFHARLDDRRFTFSASRRIWVSDGDQVTEVMEYPPLYLYRGARTLADGVQLLFFNRESSYRVWRTKGSVEDTYFLTEFTGEPYLLDAIAFGKRLFYAHAVEGSGTELWQTDGTFPGTGMVKDLYPGAIGSAPTDFIVHGSQLFFTADSPEIGRELWRLCRKPETSITSDNLVVCAGAGYSAAVPNAGPGADYAWSIQNGVITAGADKPTVAFEPDGNGPVTLNVTVSVVGGCIDRGSRVFDLVGAAPAQPGSIAGDTGFCADGIHRTYSVPEQDDADGYNWTVPADARIISGQGTSRIELLPGNTDGQITVEAYNDCGVSVPRSLAITLSAEFDTADAGPNQGPCGVTSTLLAGNPPSQGNSGFWEIVSGIGGVLADPAQADTVFTGLAEETYQLRWTLSGACGESSDVCYVTFFNPPTTADAGPDKVVCGPTIYLEGNSPTYGVGHWEAVSITGESIWFSEPYHPRSRAETEAGDLTLRWVIENGDCPASSDEVAIQLIENIISYAFTAGQDQSLAAGEIAQLDAVYHPTWDVNWTVVDGPYTGSEQFSDPAIGNPGFTPLGGSGVYTLLYEADASVCGSRSSSLELTYSPGSGSSRLTLPESACAGDVDYTAEVSGVTARSQITWHVVNGALLEGQGTPHIRFAAGVEGDVVLSVIIGDNRKAIQGTVPIVSFAPHNWRTGNARSDLDGSGRVTVLDLVRQENLCP
ncbi:MAG: hypothetical protein QNK37_05495 [Acidobacteriota bacterium]|nr:hypothetical protein [Acidobacteriota bacterium]